MVGLERSKMVRAARLGGRSARVEARHVELGRVDGHSSELEGVRRHRRDAGDIVERGSARADQASEALREARLKLRDGEREGFEAAWIDEGARRGVELLGAFDEIHRQPPKSAESDSAKASTKPNSKRSSIVSGGVRTKTSRRPPPVVVR